MGQVASRWSVPSQLLPYSVTTDPAQHSMYRLAPGFGRSVLLRQPHRCKDATILSLITISILKPLCQDKAASTLPLVIHQCSQLYSKYSFANFFVAPCYSRGSNTPGHPLNSIFQLFMVFLHIFFICSSVLPRIVLQSRSHRERHYVKHITSFSNETDAVGFIVTQLVSIPRGT